MDVKNSKPSRPSIPADLYQAARIAGAPLGLGPRDYIVLCLRAGLRGSQELPADWALSLEEISWARGLW